VKAEVFPANLRDLSYVASNLRPHDRHEIDCQSAWWSPALIAHGAMRGFAYVVWLDHNPEAAFGAAEERPGLWHIWAWGTERIDRCVPAIKRFSLNTLMIDVLNAGALRAEARALDANKKAHTLIRHLHGREAAVLRNYGKNGEKFLLFEWVRSKDWPVSVKINRPEEVLEALSPGLAPRLIGGNDDASTDTIAGVSAAMHELRPGDGSSYGA